MVGMLFVLRRFPCAKELVSMRPINITQPKNHPTMAAGTCSLLGFMEPTSSILLSTSVYLAQVPTPGTAGLAFRSSGSSASTGCARPIKRNASSLPTYPTGRPQRSYICALGRRDPANGISKTRPGRP
jgi:hypothetical protein